LAEFCHSENRDILPFLAEIIFCQKWQKDFLGQRNVGAAGAHAGLWERDGAAGARTPKKQAEESPNPQLVWQKKI